MIGSQTDAASHCLTNTETVTPQTNKITKQRIHQSGLQSSPPPPPPPPPPPSERESMCVRKEMQSQGHISLRTHMQTLQLEVMQCDADSSCDTNATTARLMHARICHFRFCIQHSTPEIHGCAGAARAAVRHTDTQTLDEFMAMIPVTTFFGVTCTHMPSLYVRSEQRDPTENHDQWHQTPRTQGMYFTVSRVVVLYVRETHENVAIDKCCQNQLSKKISGAAQSRSKKSTTKKKNKKKK